MEFSQFLFSWNTNFLNFQHNYFTVRKENCYYYPSGINMHCPQGFSCPVKTCFTSHVLGDLYDAQWLTLGNLISGIIQVAHVMIIPANSMWAKQTCFSNWCPPPSIDFSTEEHSLNKPQGLQKQLHSISSTHVKFNLVLKCQQ